MAEKRPAAKKGGAASKKQSGGAASKKSAPSKSSGGGGEQKQETKKAAQPKPGALVEFDPPARQGILTDRNTVLSDGIEFPVTGPLKEVSKKALDEGTATNIDHEITKHQTFNELDIPQHRRGENIHEQNFDLQADIRRHQAMRQAEKPYEADRKATTHGEEAEEKISELEGTSDQKDTPEREPRK